MKENYNNLFILALYTTKRLVLQNTRVILRAFITTVRSAGFNISPFSNLSTGLQSGPGPNNINLFLFGLRFSKTTHTQTCMCVISSIPCCFKLCGKINVFCAAKRIHNYQFNIFNRVV